MPLAPRSAIALEANIFWEEIMDAYRGFSSLHGNSEVLRLLVAVQYNLDRAQGDRDDALDEARSDGEEAGYKNAIDEFHEPIESAATALIACIESDDDDSELKAEIPAAIDDLISAIADMGKAGK